MLSMGTFSARMRVAYGTIRTTPLHAPHVQSISSASSLTTSTWPLAAAISAGVTPLFFGVSTFAPSSASSLSTSKWPFCAAMKAGVHGGGADR